MKIVSATEMARVESLSYSKNGNSHAAKYMEAAGHALADYLLMHASLHAEAHKQIILLCGRGNNAGDAYVAGRYLQEQGFKVVALQAFDTALASTLTQSNIEKFIWVGGTVIPHGESLEFQLPQQGVIIDGLLGTGFHGKVESPISDLIQKANRSQLPILAVDVPSGLDANTGNYHPEKIIRARWTVALEFPKKGFFLRNAWNFVGELAVVSFGLEKEFVHESKEELTLLDLKQVRSLLPKIVRTRHKYERGSLCVLAGSKGMGGAALLSCLASLRAGSGLVRLLHPEGLQVELTQAPLELLKLAYPEKINSKACKELLLRINAAKAFMTGPGLGISKSSRYLMKILLPHVECPIVIDADAINLLAEDELSLPERSILTPHRGELARLLGLEKTPELNEELLKQCQNFVEEKNVTLVLKGAPTFIFLRGRVPTVCTKGDPGMATAGSGDVLAGVLGSLLSQGLEPIEASLLGVYLHGWAGELAAKEKTSYAMIASDMIEKLPTVYSLMR